MNSFSEIGRRRLDFWDGDNLSLSLFSYKAGKSGEIDEVTQLILGFKNFDPACLSTTFVQVYDAFGKFAEGWRREFGCRFIIPVPSHAERRVSKSSVATCRFIAEAFPWLQYPEELLFRKHAARPAHAGLPWRRPTPQVHFESLGCSGVDLAGAGVILFDDLKTKGG